MGAYISLYLLISEREALPCGEGNAKFLFIFFAIYIRCYVPQPEKRYQNCLDIVLSVTLDRYLSRLVTSLQLIIEAGYLPKLQLTTWCTSVVG